VPIHASPSSNITTTPAGQSDGILRFVKVKLLNLMARQLLDLMEWRHVWMEF
jgi:hypothetical protein